MSNSEKRALSWEEKSEKPSQNNRQNHLLVIGIDAYEFQPRLNNARRDAETMKAILLERYQFKAENLIELYDEAATRRNILKAFSELESNLTEGDNLLIYFSGHGLLHKGQGFWVPVDCDDCILDGIPNDRIHNFLNAFHAHHIYLIIDACFSGSFLPRASSKAISLMEANPSRRVLTSGRDEVVSDGPFGKHSPFFSAVKNFLEDGMGPISAIDLENFVIKNTPRSAHQLPLASYIHGTGDQSGQLVFYPKRTEGEDWPKALEKNEVAAFQAFIHTYPGSSHVEESHWRIASIKDDLTSYRYYLKEYPNGKFYNEALMQMEYLEEKEVFNTAMKRGEASLRRYISRYNPDGKFLKDALAEISSLEEAHKQKIGLAESPEGENYVKETRRPTSRENQLRSEETKPRRRLVYASIPIGLVLLSLMGYFVTRQFTDSPPKETTVKLNEVKTKNAIVEEYLVKGASLVADGAFNRDLKSVEDGLFLYKLALEQDSENTLIKRKIKGVNQWIMNYNDSMMNVVNVMLPRMIEVKGGNFTMGSNLFKTSSPAHKVRVPTFFMTETEVANEEFAAFLNARKGDDSIPNWINLKDKATKIRWVKGEYKAQNEFKSHPVVNVSWEGAKAFAEWLSGLMGDNYTLPSEAQWEYAAGGGKGDRSLLDTKLLDKYANFGGGKDGYTGLAPVKSLKPNGLGLYNLLGNVSEWCEDSWHENYKNAPINGSAWVNEAIVPKVVRGGSFSNSKILFSNKTLRIEWRRISKDPESRAPDLGFRLVKTPKGS
ncbi:MAG: SUMF1/EgtB/PvdO family nonheme iron enzyme [Bacteroidia bacterium]|nr:SUMF1/EgtB/PvdO family nonheme iron enzyme [Bacteroidia bacterium]